MKTFLLFATVAVIALASSSAHAFDARADGSFTVERFYVDESQTRLFIYSFTDTTEVAGIPQRAAVPHPVQNPLDSLADFRVDFYVTYWLVDGIRGPLRRVDLAVTEFLKRGDPTMYNVTLDTTGLIEQSFTKAAVDSLWLIGRNYFQDGGMAAYKDSVATQRTQELAARNSRLAIPGR